MKKIPIDKNYKGLSSYNRPITFKVHNNQIRECTSTIIHETMQFVTDIYTTFTVTTNTTTSFVITTAATNTDFATNSSKNMTFERTGII